MQVISSPLPSDRGAVLELVERAARANPDVPSLHLAWANALEAVGRQADALDRFQEACARFPADEPIHAGYAAALLRMEKADLALAAAQAWLPSRWARKLQFRLLLRQRQFERLAELEPGLAATDPADPCLMEYRAWKWADDPAELLRACDKALAADPAAMHVIYHKAIGLAQLGRLEAAVAVMNLDDFLKVTQLSVPAPFTSRENFHAELENEIVANATLHADPAAHATRKGMRTATFPLPGDQAGSALVRALLESVEDYAANLQGNHPFSAARPDRISFKSWALVFPTGGHQVLHQHPGAWLTGVYYVKAPDDSSESGTLRIGNLPASANVRPPWPIIDVQPAPGTLVLFPSFVPHETLPAAGTGLRISVAFDIRLA